MSDVIPAGQFRCDLCGDITDIGDMDVSNAEAMANGFDIDECGSICDACYAASPWGQESTASGPGNGYVMLGDVLGLLSWLPIVPDGKSRIRPSTPVGRYKLTDAVFPSVEASR